MKQFQRLVKSITSIIKNFNEEVNALIKADKKGKDLNTLYESSDEEDSDNSEESKETEPDVKRTGNELLVHLVKSVPKANRIYIKQAIKDFVEERKEYKGKPLVPHIVQSG